jgi:hypothetical protein
MKRREKKKKLGFVGFFSRPFETSRPFSPPAVLFLHPQKKQHGKNAHALIFFFKTCFYSSYTIFITIFTAPSEQNLKQKKNYKKKKNVQILCAAFNLAVNNKEGKKGKKLTCSLLDRHATMSRRYFVIQP